jgi:hypothetical protein
MNKHILDVPGCKKRRAKLRIKAVIYGISSLVNISGRFSVMHTGSKRSDADAMREDFESVGYDLRTSMRSVRGDVPKQLKLALK